jgi:peptide/nickel transport system substrate-binding protein
MKSMLKEFPEFLFAFLLVLPLLVACQKSAMPTQEIRFGIAQVPLNLDPRYATDAASERVNRLIYQPLVDFDAASKPTWKLAIGNAVSDTESRFTLQKQVNFHNGHALTAHDVKATYDSLLSLKDSPHAAEFANIDTIEVIDDKTIIFKLKQADTHFVEKLIIGILPKSLIEKANNKSYDFSRNPVGSGPLKFESWQHDLKLKRTSDNQLITLQEVKDPTVRVLKLKKGEIDLIQGDLPPELVKHLQGMPSIRVNTGLGANYSYLGLNMQDKLLKNLKVRQAIAHAIDRQAIINKVMVSNSRIASAILPPEHYTNVNKDGTNNQLTPYDYNPVLAKKLLIEAGVKLPLKLVYKTSTDAFRVRLATIMQAQMAQAGIELEIKSLDWGTFFADVKAGNFQLYGLTWVGIKMPEIYAKAFGSNYFPPNGFNRGRYSDAELDKLLAAENWPAATQRIHTQLPYIPLWYEGQFVAMQKNIMHYAPKPDGNWDDLAIIERLATIARQSQQAQLQ